MTDYAYPSYLISSFEVLNEIEFGAYGLIKVVMKRSNFYLGTQKLYAMKVVNKRKWEFKKFMNSEIEALSWIFQYKLNLGYIFWDNDNTYIIIDYCKNGDLLKEIENKSTINQHFEEDEIWKYFIQICFGLEFLNSRWLIYHDLHPKNIFLDENKDIKLGDFGISHYIDEKDWYKDKNQKGDVRAVGRILYYLLTLKNPFEIKMKKIENYMPIQDNYSDEIKFVTDWCLTQNRDERPTINQILTHEFLVNKTISLGIAIPKKSVMRTIYNPIEKIKEIIYSQIPLLKSYNKTLGDAQNVETTILTLQELKEKQAEILNRPIDFELEQDFKRICLIYNINTLIYDHSLIHAYQNFVNTYIQHISLYKIIFNKLETCNTEKKIREIKNLETQEIIDTHTCIAKLPGGKLFCFSNANLSGITLIIHENGIVERLPSGCKCWKTSLIYFNSNVYRFGGANIDGNQSERFDLIKNQWFKLPSMPKPDYFLSNGIIFKNNFFLPGVREKNILIFSSDIESYSVIPYEFIGDSQKILIHAEKRLYLIEWFLYGSILESDVEDEFNWKSIVVNTLDISYYTVYPFCSLYYKGAIYIGHCEYNSKMSYYKFSLDEKYWDIFWRI